MNINTYKLRSSTAEHKRRRAAQTQTGVTAPRPLEKAVAGNPMFSGTIYLADLAFRRTDLNNQIIRLSQADIATVIQYMTLACPTICVYANQYGWPSVTVSQNALVGQVDVHSQEYNEQSLENWINTLAAQYQVTSSDCIVVLNPTEMIDKSDSLAGGTGGYHSTAKCPYIFVNLTGINFTLDDQALAYAPALSHELAEMIVDPHPNANPEVCDPCDNNCGHLTLNFFQKNGSYVGSVTDADLLPAYDYYLTGIVQPAFVHSCPAPFSSCGYFPEIWHPIGESEYRQIALSAYPDGRLALFALGQNRDAWKLDQVKADGPWGGWQSFGGHDLQSVAAAPNADGRLELFALGGDGAAYHLWEVNLAGVWGAWTSLGGDGLTQIVPIRDPQGVLHLFGLGKNGACFVTGQDAPNGSWGPWASLDGHDLRALQVGADANGRLELLALGGDGVLYNRSQAAPAGAFGPWTVVPIPQSSQFSLLQDDSGVLHIVALGAQKIALHLPQAGPNAPWGQWEDLTGQDLRSVGAALNADGRLEVFALGGDKKIYHRWRVVDGGWSDWRGLGASQDITFSQVQTVRTHSGPIAAIGLTSAGQPVEISQTSPNGPWN